MFNCEKCWDSPCTCGYEYRDKTTEEMMEFIYGIIKDRRDVEELLVQLIGKSVQGRKIQCSGEFEYSVEIPGTDKFHSINITLEDRIKYKGE